ncbi:MAG: hypothetical protein ABT02_18530 [Comamonadaceae bacterium SCN 68-20]|nr:MAG: hypothetical protein ABT02_18530 [Comamonadaceae bacterium SCN 68-20]
MKALRTFILWLTAFAIPLQGMAMAVMLPAGTIHGASGCQMSAGPTGHDAHAAVRANDRMPVSHDPAQQHGHAPQGVAHAHSLSAVPGATGTDHVGHGALKCCSVGFSLAAAAVPISLTRVRGPSFAPPAPAEDLYLSIVLDGPDRPPRPILA